MSTWLTRLARNERQRLQSNIDRLEQLSSQVHDLGFFALASNSGGYQSLCALLEENLVKGRPAIQEKLKSALTGENNQKIALDAPTRFQNIMVEAEEIIKREIGREQRELKSLDDDS